MRLWPLAVVFVSMSVAASAAEVAGIRLNERMSLGTSELVLNGAGLRKRAFFKVYVAGLYLTQEKTSPAEVFALAGPKRISLTLMRNLPVLELAKALKSGIHDNSSPEERQALEGRVEELSARLLAIREGKRGDVITVDWLPDAGTLVAVNGEVKGNAIPGDDVYRAVLRVWLGDHPTSAGLKKELLGQRSDDGRGRGLPAPGRATAAT